MAYLCTRCELEDLPHDTRRAAQFDPDFTATVWCENCHSNTVHTSTGGEA